MDQRLRVYYIESQVNNASPGQLLIMLYDCLIEHAESADREISAPEDPADPRPAAREVSRCINILTELNACLRHGVSPSLCATLSELYRFFTCQLYEALETRQAAKIRAIIPLLHKLRHSWVEADRRANQYQPGSVAVAA
jgi:flagellar biosynthetic protein FliS